jgi:alpha-amylase
LFYSRPAGSTRDNYYGNNRVGDRGNDEFFHPEVVAAIAFRKAMSGCAEQVEASENGAVIEVIRGNKGAALINISEEAQAIAMPTTLPAGEYTDKVHNVTFSVADSIISGELAPLASYIIY